MQKETIIQGMLMCLSYLGHLCLDLLLHPDTLAVITGELSLPTARQLQLGCVVGLFPVTVEVIGDLPLVFAQDIGDVGGIGDSGHSVLGICHGPLAGGGIVLYPGGSLSH